LAKLSGRASELFLSSKGKLRIREKSLALWGIPTLNSPKGLIRNKAPRALHFNN
jgi:hypothetical protein